MSSPLPKVVAVNIAWKMELLFNGTFRFLFFFPFRTKEVCQTSISLCHFQAYMCEKYNYFQNSDKV